MPETWKCHICGVMRPDRKISVRTRTVGGFTENIRYCNDNPDCVEKSKTFSFLDRMKPVSRMCGADPDR